MRRALAISLLLLFNLPLLSPFFGAASAEASLPACCRRGGRHQCSMVAESAMPSSGTTVRDKCPFTRESLAALLVVRSAISTARAVFAGIMQHASVAPQFEAQLRVSFDRAHQKRGPPTLVD